MPVSLSIKEVPDALAEGLRRRAARNHCSLQRELMALIEAAVAEPAAPLRTPTSPVARESQPEYRSADPADTDELLAELDAVIAGSRWGEAPLLTREHAHDRALARELDFEARSAELQATRAKTGGTR